MVVLPAGTAQGVGGPRNGQGRVYGGGKWYDAGVFSGKRAMLALTTGGPESIYQPDGLNGDIHQILYPINHGILRFTGFDVLPSFIVWGPAYLDTAARRLRPMKRVCRW